MNSLQTGFVLSVLLTAASCSHQKVLSESQQADARVYFEIGVSMIESERYPEAIQNFQKALEIDPDRADAKLNLAIALHRIERKTEAMKIVSDLCTKEPALSDCWNTLSYFQYTDKKYTLAVQSADAALSNATYTTPELPFSNKAKALYALKRYDEARATIELGLRVKPEACNLRVLYVRSLHPLGRIDKALQNARTAIVTCPRNPEAHLWEAYGLVQNGFREAALRKYEATEKSFQKVDVLRQTQPAILALKQGRKPAQPEIP